MSHQLCIFNDEELWSCANAKMSGFSSEEWSECSLLRCTIDKSKCIHILNQVKEIHSCFQINLYLLCSSYLDS